MSFEIFTKTNKNSNLELNGATINYRVQAGKPKGGLIYFNGGMRRKLDISRFTACELYVDEKEEHIALRLCNDEPSSSVVRIRRNGKTGRFITATSFIEKALSYGYPKGKNLSYETIGELIVIKKDPN